MGTILKKFIEFSLGNGIVLILGFLSSPIITRLINPEEFGKFSMFNTVVSLFTLIIILGLDQAYVRFFYEEDEEKRTSLLFNCIKIPLTINIIFSMLLLILYKPISKFVIGKYSVVLIVILILHNTFSIIGRFSLLIIRMKQRGKVYSLLQVVGKLSYLTFILLFFRIFSSDYRVLVYAIVFSNVFVVLLSLFIEKKDWIKLLDNKSKTRVRKKELISYGIPLIFSMAITWLFQSTDKIFLKAYTDYIEIGIYSSAFAIISLLNAFQSSFTTFWVPVANEKYKNKSSCKEFFIRINDIVTFVMLNIAVILITFKDQIILFLGKDYREAATIFPFLVFIPIMYTISETTVLGINFKKKTKYHIIIAIISCTVNIIGNIILVPILYAKGAAISTGISYLIFFVLRTAISNKLYKVDYKLNRIYVSITLLVGLAIVNSSTKFMKIETVLGIVVLIINVWLYRAEIKGINDKIKSKTLN